MFPVYPLLQPELDACGDHHPQIGWCTRVATHRGMHVACTDDETIGVWDHQGTAINFRKQEWV